MGGMRAAGASRCLRALGGAGDCSSPNRPVGCGQRRMRPCCSQSRGMLHHTWRRHVLAGQAWPLLSLCRPVIRWGNRGSSCVLSRAAWLVWSYCRMAAPLLGLRS